MQIKPFPAIFPKFELVPSPDSFCDSSKDLYREYSDKGFFREHAQPALYIYRIEAAHRRHTGLVALNDVEDFFSGKVKKHEKTLSEREQHQVRLFLQWEAVLKPVLLTYPPAADISDWLDRYARTHKPLFSTHFAKGHQTHRVWAVPDTGDIRQVQALFATQVRSVYIADGHHRTSTIALLHGQLAEEHAQYDFDHLFCAFFATDQLNILDYNRVVEGLEGISQASFVARLSRLFDLEVLPTPRRPEHKHELVMCLRKDWFSLRWRADVLAQYPPDQVLLDAELLNERVLRDLLGIQDVRTDQRITYVEGNKGIRGIQKQVGRNRSRVGFMLYPVTFADMMRLADLGESLPPKSTYFEPRLRSGVLVQSLLKATMNHDP